MKTTNLKLFKILLSCGISKEKIRYANLSNADLSNANLRSADLSDANLRSADLSDANLSNANLSNADLSYADLSNANLSYANLSNADLSNADLSNADLSNADLSYADLSNANLSNANLRSANLSNANLSNADLSNARINEYSFGFCIACPEIGAFIGYKKCKGTIVTLQITENAKRSSATSLKCRCSEALVLEIENGIQSICSDYDPTFTYEVGKIVKVNNFDEDRWNECSTGIHFFMNKKQAKQY